MRPDNVPKKAAAAAGARSSAQQGRACAVAQSRFVGFERGGHNDTWSVESERYLEAVREFMEECMLGAKREEEARGANSEPGESQASRAK